MNISRLALLGFLAAALSSLSPVSAYAQSHPYNEGDVIELIEGGVPATAILAKTKVSCIDFRITAAIADKLKSRGASSDLISGLKASCYRGPKTTVRTDPKTTVRTDPEPSPRIPVLLTPRRDTIVIDFPAIAVSRSEGVQLGGSAYGPNIVLNSPPYRPKFNLVEYTFSAPVAGKYRLQALMAAQSSRPLQVAVNGVLVFGSAFSDVTGGWQESNAQWVTAGDVILAAGTNTLTLSNPQFLPHLIRFRLYGQP